VWRLPIPSQDHHGDLSERSRDGLRLGTMETIRCFISG
jgi:hypothetical protein